MNKDDLRKFDEYNQNFPDKAAEQIYERAADIETRLLKGFLAYLHSAYKIDKKLGSFMLEHHCAAMLIEFSDNIDESIQSLKNIQLVLEEADKVLVK